MVIDLERHQLVGFAELAKSLPPRRGGRPVHASTIGRWRSRGIRGVRLAAVRLGGSWVTSREAFNDFVERLTALEIGETAPPLQSIFDRHASLDRELEEKGW